MSELAKLQKENEMLKTKLMKINSIIVNGGDIDSVLGELMQCVLIDFNKEGTQYY